MQVEDSVRGFEAYCQCKSDYKSLWSAGEGCEHNRSYSVLKNAVTLHFTPHRVPQVGVNNETKLGNMLFSVSVV